MLLRLEEQLWSGAIRTPPTVERLAALVADLSDLYTLERGVLRREQAAESHLDAKLFYFLLSDAPKTAHALAECAARDAAFRAPTHVVDLGCGVGATSVGFLSFLAAERDAGRCTIDRPVRIDAIDLAPASLAVWTEVVKQAAAIAQIDIRITVDARDFTSAAMPKSADLILCQTALNERLPGAEREPRYGERDIAMLLGWARSAPTLVIEPALRTTTRALQHLRDACAACDDLRIVAPCPHHRPCPMLPRERDWCHESRRIEPTPMVARVQAITRRRDERALWSMLALAPGARRSDDPTLVRCTSDPLGSRGKTERSVCCGDGRLRLLRLLDRERTQSNELLVEAERGDLLRIEPVPESDRIAPTQPVRRSADASA